MRGKADGKSLAETLPRLECNRLGINAEGAVLLKFSKGSYKGFE